MIPRTPFAAPRHSPQGDTRALRAYLPAAQVILDRSADNRKALLNSRCPLRGHRVYEVKNDNVAPFLLYAGPTSADSEPLCRVSAKRRISLFKEAYGEVLNKNTRMKSDNDLISASLSGILSNIVSDTISAPTLPVCRSLSEAPGGGTYPASTDGPH